MCVCMCVSAYVIVGECLQSALKKSTEEIQIKQGNDDTAIYFLDSTLTVFILVNSRLQLRGFLPRYNCSGVMSWKKDREKAKSKRKRAWRVTIRWRETKFNAPQ